MLATVLTIHSLLRYAVLLAAVAAAVAAVMAWRRPPAASSADRVAMGVFVGLLDLQVVLGVVLLVLRGFYGALMGHIVMMVAAAVVAHIGRSRARRAALPAAARTRLIAAVVAVVLMIGGILAIGRPVL